MHEYILDNVDGCFAASGQVSTVVLDSGEWMATGPYYHNWGASCVRLSSGAVARWDLSIPEQDTYTVSAWWPAAPEASTWSASVVAEIISAGQVVASTVFNQKNGGDQWHPLGVATLAPEDRPYVRFRSQDGASYIADALHVYSAARYNDGSAVDTVVLQPMDGILLQKTDGDQDVDGLPDQWEQQYFTDATSANPESDSDYDGFSNREEYIAGTNPRDALSYFLLGEPVFMMDGQYLLSFPTATDRVYQLQVTEDLGSGVWSNLQTYRGTGDALIITNAFHNVWQTFYRLGVSAE
jgi:hypothetical protein